MNKIFIEKCEEVFQFKNKKNIEEEELKNLQIIIGRTLIEEHRYILANYSAVFLKEGYEICSKYKSPMADEKGTEPFMYFCHWRAMIIYFIHIKCIKNSYQIHIIQSH